MTKKLTIDYIKTETSRLSEGYKCLAEEYINSQAKYNNRCNKGHIYKTCWNSFQQGGRCPKCYRLSILKEGHPRGRGGKNVAWYDTYASKIDWIEEIRRNPKNPNYLQVKCKNCNTWITPSMIEVDNRVSALLRKGTGECNFYCSDKCKQSCSIFGRVKYYKNTEDEDIEKGYCREWKRYKDKDSIKQRDNYKCQNEECWGKSKKLIIHHIDYNKKNCEDKNLITLCYSCNTRADYNRKYWKEYYENKIKRIYGI